MERSRSLLGDKHSRPISRHRSCRRHRRSTFRWVRLSVGPASISASTAVVPTAEAAGRTQSPLFPPTGTFAFGGYLIGGTVGGNYQIGSFVIGLGGDGDWSHLSGTTFNISCVVVGCETKSDWLATVRGRAGWAWDRVLFYGTGGAAFANVQAAAGGPPVSSSTQVGWTAGAGIEYAFTPNWTAKVEYLFVDLQNASCGAGNCSFAGSANSISLSENIIRAGVNFKFW